jgi:hypothetical protein
MHKLWLSLAIVGLILPAAACGGGGGTSATSPQPGAVLSGPIEISGKASSGTIGLTVSDDGASVTSVKVTLTELKCDGFSAGSLTKEVSGAFAAAKGKVVASLSGIGKIDGRFTSPTAASGTIDLALEIPMGGGTCKLGTQNWSAEAD